MADVARPTPEQVRVAAEDLKAAIDRHLDAVIRRQGEADPDVFEAFDALAAAAETYDELLYEVYDEVTPFEVPEGSDDEGEEPAEPEALSVFIRRDYHVADPDTLIESAREAAAAEEGPEDEAGRIPVTGIVAAAAVLFDTYEPDEIHARCEELGLWPGDDTLWLVTEPIPAESGEWLENPFGDVDTRRVVYRVDTTNQADDADGILPDGDDPDPDLVERLSSDH